MARKKRTPNDKQEPEDVASDASASAESEDEITPESEHDRTDTDSDEAAPRSGMQEDDADPENEDSTESGSGTSSNDSVKAQDPNTSPDDEQAPDEVAEPLGEPTASDEINVDARPDMVPPEPEPPQQVETRTVVERKGGFVPMVLGGVIAAAIGFGAAVYMLPGGWLGAEGPDETSMQADLEQLVQDQAADVQALSEQVASLSDSLDSDEIRNVQSDISDRVAELDDRLGNFGGRLDGLETRITELEEAPPENDDSGAADAATYENQIAGLQDAVDNLQADVDTMTQRAREQEEAAQNSARATLRRAALTRIQTALDNGSGFAPALADLEETGIDIPEELGRVAESGVASLAELRESFPDAARSALEVSRQLEDDADQAGGVIAFLKSQLGVRSLTPRDGDDPDAILSRAEAALREGRLNDALAEIETLPEEGRSELSGWAEDAARRLEAINAAETLTGTVN